MNSEISPLKRVLQPKKKKNANAKCNKRQIEPYARYYLKSV